MKTNVKTGIAFSCVAVASFIAGFLLSGPIISHELAAGDISRARVYTKSVVTIDSDNLQERLLSDTTYCEAANSRAEILKSHAHQLAELIVNTENTFGNDEKFASAVNCMNAQKKTIDNACAAIDTYAEKLAELSSGKKVKDFEQIYNNAMLSSLVLTQNSGLTLAYDNVAVFYDKESEKYDEMHNLWGQWMGWLAVEKLMIGQTDLSKEVVNYAENHNLKLTGGVDLYDGGSLETLGIAFTDQNKVLGIYDNAAFDFGYRILGIEQLSGNDKEQRSASEQLGGKDKEQRSASEQLGGKDKEQRSSFEQLGGKDKEQRSASEQLGGKDKEQRSASEQLGGKDKEQRSSFEQLGGKDKEQRSSFEQLGGKDKEQRSAFEQLGGKDNQRVGGRDGVR